MVHEPARRRGHRDGGHAVLPRVWAHRGYEPRGPIRGGHGPRAAARSGAPLEGHSAPSPRVVLRRTDHLQHDQQLAARDEVRPELDRGMRLRLGTAPRRDSSAVRRAHRREARRGLRSHGGRAGHTLQPALRRGQAEGRIDRHPVSRRRIQDRRPRDRRA